jgi:protein TonB
VQEQASLLMPKESNAQEEPVMERKSSEAPQPQEPLPAPQEPTPKPQEPLPALQEPAPKPQEPPTAPQEPAPVSKAKPVAKPAQVAQPPKKQALTDKSTIQKGAADPSGREESSGSSQSRESASSEGSNASDQVPPKLVKSPKPRYPSESIRLRQEGRVIVNIEVLENGSVGQASIAQSSGFSALDQSALETVKNWQYASGSGSGSLVKQRVQAGIIFELKNR